MGACWQHGGRQVSALLAEAPAVLTVPLEAALSLSSPERWPQSYLCQGQGVAGEREGTFLLQPGWSEPQLVTTCSTGQPCQPAPLLLLLEGTGASLMSQKSATQ